MDGKFSHETVAENIRQIRENIKKAALEAGRNPDDVLLLAATKTVDADTINFAVDNGITCIGENRVQELCDKYDAINKDKVDIHFIGTLQTNKVKYIADKVSMIHSVDSVKLAKEIDKQCKKIGKVMNVLVEINIGKEESKGGIMPEDCEEFLKEISVFENIRVCGLMTIPPKCVSDDFQSNQTTFDSENCQKMTCSKISYKNQDFFKKIMKLFLDISQKKLDNIYMQYLSMGMSDDYEQAVTEGSSIVRVGRSLFGSRI